MTEIETMRRIRGDLEPLPDHMKSLPICPKRIVTVPWFVAWVDGVPEFRCFEKAKWLRAVRDKLCWVCGERLGRFMVFVSGPMCGINRTSSEPPCHLACAQWSARNCPFLSKPQMVRRENDMPEDGEISGIPILRNPGVTLLWITKAYELFADGMGGMLIEMGEPDRVEWWALGKPATREQVEESVRTGLPKLEALARQQDGGMDELRRRAVAFETLYPN